MNRRRFVQHGVASGMGLAAAHAQGVFRHGATDSQPLFTTRNASWQAAYDKAVSILSANVQLLPGYDRPVLIEGSEYAGTWQECGPQESLVYRRFRPDVTRNSHMIFFNLQRGNGQLPYAVKRMAIGFAQIQMVVPIAATAWEAARDSGDSELLERAYHACSRWDAWLMRYRNTRETGLIEGFCTYDTGMDNSPRWAGMPRQCPDGDAALCPAVPTLPRLCPDLSATVYGARRALAAMAVALGKPQEADAWTERAETLRGLILKQLYVPEDASFFDLDARNQFVRVRSVVDTRVCSEHVVEQTLFDTMWDRQLGNPLAFWAPYPFPSVALNDPAFLRPLPANSWGGASQALTALRAGRWMEHYGRAAEFCHLMAQWCAALQLDMTFRQQVDPLTGVFTPGGLPNYSPASLLMYEFTWRLAGIHEQEGLLHWNARPGAPAAEHARFSLTLPHGLAQMQYTARAVTLTFAGRSIAEVEGAARLITDARATPLALLGVSMQPQQVVLRLHGRAALAVTLQANQRIDLTSGAGPSALKQHLQRELADPRIA